MFDIHFYQKAHNLEKELRAGRKLDKKTLLGILESFRRKEPVVWNIETTNACNMRCGFCPRTTKMTRHIKTITKKQFEHVADQLRPWSDKEWEEWESFVKNEYGISERDIGENHFFLYVLPRVIQLHGYGEPLLDKNISSHVRALTKRGIGSYFSCNPANIHVDKLEKLFAEGLSYIKFSIETTNDEKHKQLRGPSSDFTTSHQKILELLERKRKHGYGTTVVVTMIDLNQPDQEGEYRRLREAFKGEDVYLYLKSQDTLWLKGERRGTKSVHWSEFCKHPWMLMAIKSDGKVAMCMQDYNNAIILGDTTTDSLKDIWNSERYSKFREAHLDLPRGIQCTEECDMVCVGEYLPKINE